MERTLTDADFGYRPVKPEDDERQRMIVAIRLLRKVLTRMHNLTHPESCMTCSVMQDALKISQEWEDG